MREPAAALSLSGLSKEFGGLRAVDGVSLTVGPGERRAIQPPRYELAPTQQGWQRRQV